MTKDVMLHIVGRQAYSEEDDCKAEFFTEGKIFEKNNEVFVEYDETELSGFMGGHTILTIRDNEIIMSRANCESGAGDEVVGKAFWRGVVKGKIGARRG